MAKLQKFRVHQSFQLGLHEVGWCIITPRKKFQMDNCWSCVPQGAVMGHVLSLIYTNDTDNVLSKVHEFADDTKLEHSCY